MRAIHPPARAFRAECTTTPAAGITNFKTMPDNLPDIRINGLGAANASCCGIVAMGRRGARKVLLPIMIRTVRGIILSSSFPEAREMFSKGNHQKSKFLPLARGEDPGRSCMYEMIELHMKGEAMFLFGPGKSHSIV